MPLQHGGAERGLEADAVLEKAHRQGAHIPDGALKLSGVLIDGAFQPGDPGGGGSRGVVGQPTRRVELRQHPPLETQHSVGGLRLPLQLAPDLGQPRLEAGGPPLGAGVDERHGQQQHAEGREHGGRLEAQPPQADGQAQHGDAHRRRRDRLPLARTDPNHG